MSQVLTPTLQRKSNFKLRKIRELSLPGDLKVKVGDMVNPNDRIAQAEFPGELLILRISENLGIDPKDVIRSLKVQEGQEVSPAQTLCEHKGLFGLFKNVFTAPDKGKIEFINKETGNIGLRLPSYLIELNAYIAGQVVALEDRKSVTIESTCTYIQGIFGVGGEKSGILQSLSVPADTVVTASEIPADCHGKILFGGASGDIDALRTASERGAVGFICGSIDDRALAEYLGYDIGIALTGNEKISMTLILTEGFGKLSFSKTAYELLLKCQGMQASINGATQVRAGALRPEIIVNFPGSLESELAAEPLMEVGKPIRIIREPYFGLHAKVLEMPFKPEIIETGAEVRILKAELTDGRIVKVPRANVEIL